MEVRTLQGRLLGIADAWFDEVALAWEINSYAWHLLPQYYAHEVKRTAGLTAVGVAVLPVLPTSLRDDGDLTGRTRGRVRRCRTPSTPSGRGDPTLLRFSVSERGVGSV